MAISDYMGGVGTPEDAPFGSEEGGTFGGTAGGIGSSIGGGIGSYLAQLLAGGRSPFQAEQPYMHAAGGDISQYLGKAVAGFQPYLEAGKAGLGQYMGMLGQEADPTAFYNKMMGGFALSPAQQFAQQQGLEAVQNRMTAGGFAGSGPQAEALEKYAQLSTGQAQQQYLHNLMGMYGQALGGFGRVAGMGEQAAGQVGRYYTGAGQDLAQLQQEQAMAAAAQARAREQGIGAIGGDIGSLIGSAAQFA